MAAPRGAALAPYTTTIEGKETLVVERTPPLQPSLDRLLAAMITWTRNDVRPRGAREACEVLREHDMRVLAEGRHLGLDSRFRDLRVTMCGFCGTVCVRDISVDRMDGLPIGRGGPRRRDVILGWYTGKRRSGREYR